LGFLPGGTCRVARLSIARPFPDLLFGKKPQIRFGLLKRFLCEMTAKAMDKAAAIQRAELYYQLHPRSPSAVRSPKLFVRSGLWIALLGRSVREGIAGFGPTVEAALRAFDAQYLATLRPPEEVPQLPRAA
jgi:hypothetical protein